MPTIDVNGLRMYYELRGHGSPLVVILGLGGDVAEHTSLIDGCAADHTVLAFDSRGAGRTDKPREPYTMAMLADDTAGLMRALDIPSADVLGISLGGRIAMELAVRHPELVDRLVLVSTAARIINGPRRWFRMNVLSRLRRSDGLRYAFVNQRAASDHYDGRPLLPRITAPTLILHGRTDTTAPFHLAEELHAGIAGARLVPFEGAHMFPMTGEQQRFHAEVAAFLAR